MVEDRGITNSEEEFIPSEEFINTAKTLIEEAQKEGIILRVIGALAIRIHSTPEMAELHKKLGRFAGKKQEFTDIDFVGLSKQRKKVRKFLESRGWKFDAYMFMFASGMTSRNRHIYRGRIDIDVFFDEIDACHKIPLKDRLLIEPITISLTDLLLTKLQIVEFSEKDAKDVIVLLRGHQIGEEDAPETINAKYIAKLLADDWGFWYTATTNLKKLKEGCRNFKELSEEDIQDVVNKIDLLLKYIDEEPKTKKWKKRAKIGTKKKWYKEVRL